MPKEYRTIQEVAGPLMLVQGVDHVTYDEIGEIELANKLDRALDICMFEKKKYVITGRDTGATAQEFTDYVLETIASL